MIWPRLWRMYALIFLSLALLCFVLATLAFSLGKNEVPFVAVIGVALGLMSFFHTEYRFAKLEEKETPKEGAK